MELSETLEVVRLLSEGVDPLTGEVLPNNHLINQPQVIRALCHARELLQNRVASKVRPENQGKPWLEHEERRLREAFQHGDKIKDMAAAHKRSTGAIRSRLEKLGLVGPA